MPKKDPSAKGRHARRKGSTNELQLCRILSQWWFEDDYKGIPAKELPFRRTPLSGGFDTSAVGDIRIMDHTIDDFPFSVEAKDQECWDFSGMFKGNKAWPVDLFWEQTLGQAVIASKHPLLIFTKNRFPFFIRLKMETAYDLDIANGIVDLRDSEIYDDFTYIVIIDELLKIPKSDVLKRLNLC